MFNLEVFFVLDDVVNPCSTSQLVLFVRHGHGDVVNEIIKLINGFFVQRIVNVTKWFVSLFRGPLLIPLLISLDDIFGFFGNIGSSTEK